MASGWNLWVWLQCIGVASRCCYAAINVTPHPPLYGDRWGIGGDLTHRMCQIPHPSITIQCQIPTLYIHTRICAGTRANACAGQKPHPWGIISWRIPYQAPPLSPTGGVGPNIDRRIIRRYIDILIIIINFLYSTCIRSFFGSSILTSLFIFKCFFGLVSVIFLQYIANVTHRTFEIVQKIEIPRM